MEPHYYAVDLKWTTERLGMLSAPGIEPTIEVATPPQFPKGVDGIWSPEHLLTAAVNSCFMTTFLSIADNFKLVFISFTCSARGKMEKKDGKFFISLILLEPVLEIASSVDKERAERLLQKAEKACLISNSLNCKTNMVPTVKINV